MMIFMAGLNPDQRELVHRFFDGELDPDEAALAEALIAQQPEARRILAELRGIDRGARNELLAASAREDFTDWWKHVERQMTSPSLEPPTGVDPIRPPGTISVVEGEIRAASMNSARGWLIAIAFATVSLATAAGVILIAIR